MDAMRGNIEDLNSQLTSTVSTVNTKATKPTYSVGFSGWYKDTTSGLVDEWGYFDWNSPAGGVLDQTIVLPLALTSILSIQVTVDDSASGNWGNTRLITATSSSGASIRLLAVSTAAEAGVRVRWLVKGV
ncbi:hypothetical protein [Paenibacillus sp. sgz5001063]|uniref:hypothetical protein n=1 Tax=Paenibacillus sp. sgz5001063 TaxID=3242474 RepID=UPI0036D3AAED